MSQVCVMSIYVSNLQKAIEFYTHVLGFEVNKQYGPKIVTLVHGEIPIVLEETSPKDTNHMNNGSGVVLGLKTNNINETVTFLKEHGVEFIIGEPTNCPPGKYISFKDPFGNVFEYLQFA